MPARSAPRLRPLRGLVPAALLLLLGACASIHEPSPPEGRDVPAPSARQEFAGEVRNVDHGNRRFLLEREEGGTVDIAWDDRTRLQLDGREQPVAGLEPGDRVRLLATREGRLWHAQDIEVLGDARGGAADAGLAERSGAIAFVDPRAGVIGYTRGGFTGGEARVRYDRGTVVEYRGERYPPEALEPGDLVRMQLRRSDVGWVAERIEVEVSARER